MREVITTAIVALLAVFVFAAPKTASALPAQAAIDYSQNSQTTSDLVEVKRNRYRRGRSYRGPRYRGGYRGGYRGRGYYGRSYYGRGYGYRRRGGVTIQIR
ncbi:MAG: hypothetical protein KBT60_06510 [Methyloceanibacter sp.]|nr:hypothetical protein [Methyloceanibacter sp.]